MAPTLHPQGCLVTDTRVSPGFTFPIILIIVVVVGGGGDGVGGVGGRRRKIGAGVEDDERCLSLYISLG